MTRLHLIPNTGTEIPDRVARAAPSTDGSRTGAPRLRLVADTGSRHRPRQAHGPYRAGSVLPRWVSLAVGASAAMASAIVAIIGFSPGSIGLASELDLISSARAPWVWPQPLSDPGGAEAGPFATH